MKIRILSKSEKNFVEEIPSMETKDDMGYLQDHIDSEPTGRKVRLDDLRLVDFQRFEQETPWTIPRTDAVLYGEDIGADYVLLRRGGSFLKGFFCDAKYYKNLN